ncbi:gluconokinase [Gemmobacter aquatilis]|uniref:gluconokinase n=1 Tax=Gemmobacter aquatilis TaxID=933059 RepID=UPI001FDFC5E3|nr:gluconokinase [Gemmobacter aquatilis]
MSLRVVVMGVSGCGKSTLGRVLASALGARFVDADDLHPAENIAKMAAGQPLDDADRVPWLDRCAAALAAGPVVLACSALKRRYRDRLRVAAPDLRLIHLAAPQTLLAGRLVARTGHFMPAGLLASQFAALEVPDGEGALVLDAMAPLEAQLATALRALV